MTWLKSVAILRVEEKASVTTPYEWTVDRGATETVHCSLSAVSVLVQRLVQMRMDVNAAIVPVRVRVDQVHR